MNKTMETMRKGLVENTTVEKLLESSSVMLSRELNKKEFSIYQCICELVASGKLSMGYQFGIKRFNSMFVQWENGKATEKTTVLPSVTEIANACKYFYGMNGKENDFFPIVRINNDGTIIIDCIKYLDNFYSLPTEKKEVKISREKQLEKIGKMILSLNDEINNAIANNVLENSDINDVIKSIGNLDILKALEKSVEKTTKRKHA